MESGKDKLYRKFQSPCTQCAKASFDKGVQVKGRTKFPRAYTPEALFSVYEQFEAERIETAKTKFKITEDIRPDPFLDFIVTRTDLCPHKLITPQAAYWLETIQILDTEMGLSLPGKMEELPAIFFDALTTVRTERNKVRAEEKDG